MKVLSLWQPYATLVVIGAKKIETRCWSTKHRGPLAIHASLKDTRALRGQAGRWPFNIALKSAGVMIAGELPRGFIVGVVNLDGVDEMHADGLGDSRIPWPSPPELDFGIYAPGRFAWHLSNPRQFIKPVPAEGMQRLFNFDDVLLAEAIRTSIAPQNWRAEVAHGA